VFGNGSFASAVGTRNNALVVGRDSVASAGGPTVGSAGNNQTATAFGDRVTRINNGPFGRPTPAVAAKR
jgi:hypothetical protein